MGLIERQIQRRIMHVKLCVARAYFTRLDAKQFLVELDALLDTLYVEREVRLQRRHFPSHLAFHLSLLYIHIRLSECKRTLYLLIIFVKAYVLTVRLASGMTLEITEMSLAEREHVLRIYVEGIATGQATFETEAPSWEEWDGG